MQPVVDQKDDERDRLAPKATVTIEFPVADVEEAARIAEAIDDVVWEMIDMDRVIPLGVVNRDTGSPILGTTTGSIRVTDLDGANPRVPYIVDGEYVYDDEEEA